jgi:quercetin dioxygenase-like cupin family protein
VSATVVHPGDGEVIYDFPAGGIRLLLGGERLVLSEIRFGPGNDGPAPHIHRTHSDGFYVIEGELTVRLGDGERQLPAGGLVLIPPGVVHTVRNTSDADVVMLNIHAPGSGFDSYLRAGRDGDQATRDAFDQDEPPPHGGRPASDATFVRAADGEHVVDGGDVAVTVGSGEPGGDASAVFAVDGERFVSVTAPAS